MKLSAIWEGLSALPTSPQDRETARKQAGELAGDSAEAQTQVQKSLEAQKKAQDLDPKTGKSIKQGRKKTLSQLGNIDWNPKNTTFQKLAGQALGGGQAK